MNMRVWVAGLISAAAGGATGVLGVAVIAPQDFNWAHIWTLLGCAGFMAFTHALMYLQRSPIWDERDEKPSIDPRESDL